MSNHIKTDSHFHLWQLARGDYDWMSPDLGRIYRDFSPADYAAVTSGQNVSKAVLVQAAETVNETEYLLELAATTDMIGGVVGWIDMEADDAIATLVRLAGNPGFKGIRPMLQDIEDPAWIANPAFHAIFDRLATCNLSFDALVLKEHLVHILKIARNFPGLRIVVDHCAKPDIARKDYDEWLAAMTPIAACENVWVKFSGLTTEASDGDIDPATYQPYFDAILNLFGDSRIMWGSDWPVINLKNTYEDWVSICSSLTINFTEEQRTKFWAANAREFYRIM